MRFFFPIIIILMNTQFSFGEIPNLENTLDSAKKDTLETGKTSKNE